MNLYSSVCGNSSINIKKYILPMLLTEDYFKDIEDDDIIVSDDVNVINDTTLEDFNTKNVSEFD